MLQSAWGDIRAWTREAARQLNPILQGYPYPILASAPSGVSAGYTYYDTTLAKVRTWDGTLWQNHF